MTLTPGKCLHYVKLGEYAPSALPPRQSEATLRQVPADVRRDAYRLGLGDLNAQRRCLGYGNCCTCPGCQERAKLINEHRAAGRNPYTADGLLRPRPAKPQPWQTEEAA